MLLVFVISSRDFKSTREAPGAYGFLNRSPRSIGISVSNGFDGWRLCCDFVRADISSSSGTFLSDSLEEGFFENAEEDCGGRTISSFGGRLSQGAGVSERVSPF